MHLHTSLKVKYLSGKEHELTRPDYWESQYRTFYLGTGGVKSSDTLLLCFLGSLVVRLASSTNVFTTLPVAVSHTEVWGSKLKRQKFYKGDLMIFAKICHCALPLLIARFRRGYRYFGAAAFWYFKVLVLTTLVVHRRS